MATIDSLRNRLDSLFKQETDLRAKIKRTSLMLEESQRQARALAKARRLAKKYGIDIERENDGYWVTSRLFDDGPNDPLNGSHFCVGGLEVLQGVEAYVEAHKKIESETC